jgi:DNA-binding transcriptional MerR regulator
MTYSVKQVSKAIGKHPNTVRGWTDRYADHLSDHASPAEGQERRYTDEDVEVLAAVAYFTDQGHKHADIMARITAGDRALTVERPEAGDRPIEEARELATTDLLERFIVRYEERIDALEKQLDDERQARLEAEKQAANLSGRLEAMENRRPWWRFWKS